ncbi:MAG TPA: hypothetical protein VKU02_15610 [Gemmataceae bacterium]|nr:hypothetical protein [Gemmataceae bacterium]
MVRAGPVVDSKFLTVTKPEAEELSALKPLTASAYSAELLLVALIGEAHGVYEEALALYRKRADMHPAEANFQIARASDYERSGHADLAKAARQRAIELGAALPEK